jgi:hypothetical protein
MVPVPVDRQHSPDDGRQLERDVRRVLQEVSDQVWLCCFTGDLYVAPEPEASKGRRQREHQHGRHQPPTRTEVPRDGRPLADLVA